MTKCILQIGFLLLIACSCTGNIEESQAWELVYENDAEGNPVIGEFQELVAAIRDGKSLKIYFKMGDEDETYVEHSAMVKFTTILNSPNGQSVAGQIDPIIGQTPDFGESQVLQKEQLEWSLIASTSGKNDTMMRNILTGEVVSHRITNWGTKWYVNN